MSQSNSSPVPKPGIMEIDAYVPGKSAAHPDRKPVKLSSNESPLGPSPRVAGALAGLTDNLQLYPDGTAGKLREAIATAHGLNAANIICGNGSDDILSLLANTYLAPGDEAIYSRHGFLYYRIVILAAGATPVVADEVDCTTSVDDILSRVTSRTKMVFIANPNNPTGTYLAVEEVKRLREGLPETAILVLDGAYAEYVKKNDFEAGIELVSSSNNVVMTRTFSKIHGLASLRIGWGYAPTQIIEAINRIRGPFNLNHAAILAGSAAIGDHEHIAASVEHNEKWLNWLTGKLSGIGLAVTPSVGNFILIHFPDKQGKTAADADEALLAQGLILRRVTAYGFPNALRMTIGNEEANRSVVDCLTQFLNR